MSLEAQAGQAPPVVPLSAPLVPPPPLPVPPQVPHVSISKKLKEARQLSCISFKGDLEQPRQRIGSFKFLRHLMGSLTVEKYEARFNELMSYVPDLVKTELDQANYFEEGLRNEIRDCMTVIGRKPYKEVVQMALRAKKLATKNRSIWAEFAKRRNPNIFSSQPSKKGKDSSASRSVTTASVAYTCPPSQQPQQKFSRFSRSTVNALGKSLGVLTNTETMEDLMLGRVESHRDRVQRCGLVWGVIPGRIHPLDRRLIPQLNSDRSYVSTTFASFFYRNLSPLKEEIVVHTPLGEQLVRNTCYRDCGIRVGEEEFRVDLIPLEI
ncbi:hypothetical protein QQP08_015244 [Theobroma cacao]|nr:hypothetical protein QQP08_015244 [Theobroma cacao]